MISLPRRGGGGDTTTVARGERTNSFRVLRTQGNRERVAEGKSTLTCREREREEVLVKSGGGLSLSTERVATSSSGKRVGEHLIVDFSEKGSFTEERRAFYGTRKRKNYGKRG